MSENRIAINATAPKIRCNNCMKYFKDDCDLERFYDENGALDGCPDCKTDEYLMDLE